MEKRALKITDIAEMIYLADGVLWASRCELGYNENGVELYGDARYKQHKKDKADGIAGLVESYIRSFHDLSDAIDITPAEILENLSPLKNRILGMFRNGEVDIERTSDKMYVDPSVPDEWLMELFAMRVRDKIISFVLQKGLPTGRGEKQLKRRTNDLSDW